MTKTRLIIGWLMMVCSVAFTQTPLNILSVDAPHGDIANLPNLCTDCHFGYNAPNATATINDKCLSCHNGTTAPAAETHRGLSCIECHNPHHQEQERTNGSTYSKLIRTTINGRTVKLMSATGANSFADGDAVRDGVCEVCHSTTQYHRNNGTGSAHNNGADCRNCHTHNVGFAGGAGGPNCLGCHQNPMGSRRAVGPDFTGQQHHPLTFNASGNLNIPADNNCLICHKDYPGLHGNGVVNLNPDPDNSGSAEWEGIYDDPFCMDCHDGNNPDPNYRLGGIIAPDKRSFYSSSNVHRNGTAFSGLCSDCHNESNSHTASTKFFSSFYSDGKEENLCYGCHGGAANVNTSGRYMENIRVAYTGGNINSQSKHASSAELSTSDGSVVCRNCHDPHLLNHTTNLLIDPQNITTPWSGTTNDYCKRCHTGNADWYHTKHVNVTDCGQCHNFSGPDPSCSNCHLPHSSTLPKLMQLNISGKTLSVSPSTVSILLSNTQQFDAILSPMFSEFNQTEINKLSTWSFVTTSGGSAGTEYMKTEYIPLDRSIGYDPNANGGWGLITVTSTISIPDATTIEDLNVYFNATHHYRGDIDLTLKHIQTGTTVHVQAYDWWDWQTNLVFWYDSESPNGQHGEANPRSTAESLTLFNGESISGDWSLTILDTWPSDNSTNPASPDFCKVNSWGLRLNGGVVGIYTSPGLFSTLYAGTGSTYATVHHGKLHPAQNGLDVSVSENPLPLQSTASVTVTTATGASTTLSSFLPPIQSSLSEVQVSSRLLMRANARERSAKEAHLNKKAVCSSCHRR